MVDFLIMSLLVTLCLELNPVHKIRPAVGLEVATSQTSIEVYEASIFRMLVER